MTITSPARKPTTKSSSGKSCLAGERDWQLGEVLFESAHHEFLRVSSGSGEGLLKLAKGPSEALSDEAEALSGSLSFAVPYVPEVIDRGVLKNPQGPASADQLLYGPPPSATASRHGIVFDYVRGLTSLEKVAAAYPDGIDARDGAWILRRLLMAIGYAHAAGRPHGAVLARHVLIEPADHGLVLVDWQGPENEQRPGETWAPELLDGGQPTPATDVFMAIAVIKELIEPDTCPAELSAFFEGCMHRDQSRRPQSAWRLKDEYDQLIERLWGRRRFRPFEIPKIEAQTQTTKRKET